MFAKSALILMTLLFTPVVAQAEIAFTNPSIATPPGKNAVAYFTVKSDAADTILSASSPVCAAVELHTHTMDGDVMRMRRVPSVELPAGEAITFAPHGLHVMLIGLKAPLTPGQAVPVTFRFAQAPEQTLNLTVPHAPHLHDGHQSPTGHTH